MARGGGLNLVGAAFSQLTLLLISVVLARALGRADVGLYFQAYAFLSLLNLLSLSGFRAGMTRFVAVHLVEGDRGAVRGTVRLGLLLTISVSVLLAGALALAAPWLAATAFDDPRLASPLRYVAVALPLTTFTDAALAATQGFSTMRPFALIGRIVEPALRTGLTFALLATGSGVAGAMTALVLSHLVSAVLAARALSRLIGPSAARPVYRPRELFGFSMVSWAASLASTGLIWADTIVLGIYLPTEQVGVYAMATRLVVLASFVMAPINGAFAPRIADLYHRGRTTTLSRVYRVATSWILRLSLPAFVLLAVFPDDLLALFGPAFVAGATVTLVLAAGKLVDAATGPCGLMLNMSGRPLLSMIDNVVVLLLNVGLNIWLIPRHGILGSAVAWAVALGIVNLARVLQVRVIMGMLPFDLGSLKALAAAAIAVAVGVGVRLAAPSPSELALGSVSVVVAYVVTVAALKLTDEDRVVLGMITTRLRRTTGRRAAGPQLDAALEEAPTEPARPPASRGGDDTDVPSTTARTSKASCRATSTFYR